jgi:hypothetical protein
MNIGLIFKVNIDHYDELNIFLINIFMTAIKQLQKLKVFAKNKK